MAKPSWMDRFAKEEIQVLLWEIELLEKLADYFRDTDNQFSSAMCLSWVAWMEERRTDTPKPAVATQVWNMLRKYIATAGEDTNDRLALDLEERNANIAIWEGKLESA
jgi:hypothetical protein